MNFLSKGCIILRVVVETFIGFSNKQTNGEESMDVLAERLDAKLREWKPDTAAEVKERIAEIIDLTDQDALDIMRSRAVEQEVLDLLDEPISD